MALFFLRAFGLAVLTVPVYCLNANQYCGDGVQTAIGQFTFNGTTSDDYWGNLCSNELGVLSLAVGVKSYCSSKAVSPGWGIIAEYCTESGYELPGWTDVLPKLSDDFVRSLQVVEFADIDATVVWNNSVLISESLYDASSRTTEVFEKEYTIHQRYGWAVYGFWGAVLLAGMLNRLISHFLTTSVPRRHDPENVHQTVGPARGRKVLGPLVLWIQTHLTLPPVFGTRHQERMWTCAIPTRLETIIIAAYWILNFVLCCVSYEIFYPNLYYTEAMQTWRYIVDRTGILSYANLPWLWLFAGRNNIFSHLTGYSFSTFNLFHRHVARVATLQAIVHSIAYTAMEVSSGYLAEDWAEEYWYMGGMATITMSLLLGLSSFWLRRHVYEVFLLIHIAFAVIIIVGLFYHTAIFEGEYDGYLWPLVAIWLFDRVARIARLVYCNVNFSIRDGLLAAPATVSYNQDSDLLTIEVPVVNASRLRLTPGQHYFIYQPGSWNFWENHPFTLATWTSLQATADKPPLSPRGHHAREEKALGVTLSPHSPSRSPSSSSLPSTTNIPDPSTATETLIFFARPQTRSGFTHRLKQACLRSSPLPTNTTSSQDRTSHTITTRLLLEGPYHSASSLPSFTPITSPTTPTSPTTLSSTGTPTPPQSKTTNDNNHDASLLLLGGSGISAGLPYILSFAAHLQSRPTTHPTTPRMKVIWTTRQEATVRAVVAGYLLPLLSSGGGGGVQGLEWEFYATGEGKGKGEPAIVAAGISGGGGGGSSSSSNISSGAGDSGGEGGEGGDTQRDKKGDGEGGAAVLREKSLGGGSSRTGSASVSASGEMGQGLNITFAHPDLSAMVREFVAREAAAMGSRRVAVFVCGPAGMADAVRMGVLGCLKGEKVGEKEGVEVGYFEEEFGW